MPLLAEAGAFRHVGAVPRRGRPRGPRQTVRRGLPWAAAAAPRVRAHRASRPTGLRILTRGAVRSAAPDDGAAAFRGERPASVRAHSRSGEGAGHD